MLCNHKESDWCSDGKRNSVKNIKWTDQFQRSLTTFSDWDLYQVLSVLSCLALFRLVNEHRNTLRGLLRQKLLRLLYPVIQSVTALQHCKFLIINEV